MKIKKQRENNFKTKGIRTAKVACNLILRDDLFMPNPDLPCSLWQSIPLAAVRAGFGPGEASACIPSCSVQLPRRNAGLPRARARDGLQTPREKQIPPRHLGLNPAGATAQSDKVTLNIIQFGFFSLTSMQPMSEPALY